MINWLDVKFMPVTPVLATGLAGEEM